MTGAVRPALVRVGAGAAVADLLCRRATDALADAAVVVVDPGLEALASQLAPGAEVVVATADLVWTALPAHRTVRLVAGDGVSQPPGEPVAIDVVPALGAGAEAAALATVADLAAVRPLAGLTVVVTRAADQADGLATPLARLGARVLVLPTIAIEPPSDGGAGLAAALAAARRSSGEWGSAADALASGGRYDWIVVTSVNGARRVLDHVADARTLAGVKLAAIGPATAAALADAHLPADLVPPSFVAESLLDVFPAPPPGGGRVLLARRRWHATCYPRG